ncbi:hypothetical protein THAOC_18301 [Thalassiosira oceanica]|uniref:Alpha-carbonic anhydrase domain-containing protein n=1 Tax=Thalassiosira oceanica TaxID=159749 RepID=K0S5B9_THAOC|nr:hypothetical protein THAOC_18301 [Thalassiosira oceanica]|eukprot:EJK61248.1 hypothetical protein THAOC_18301 [Thalassiosira oceanica]
MKSKEIPHTFLAHRNRNKAQEGADQRVATNKMFSFGTTGKSGSSSAGASSGGGFSFSAPSATGDGTKAAAPAAGGFSFGAPSATEPSKAPAPGGLFGGTSATTTNASAPSTGGFSFGAPASVSANAAAKTGGDAAKPPAFSFGGPAPAAAAAAAGDKKDAAPAGGGLFGASSSAGTDANLMIEVSQLITDNITLAWFLIISFCVTPLPLAPAPSAGGGGLFGGTAPDAKKDEGKADGPAPAGFSFGAGAPAAAASSDDKKAAASAPAGGFSFGGAATTDTGSKKGNDSTPGTSKNLFGATSTPAAKVPSPVETPNTGPGMSSAPASATPLTTAPTATEASNKPKLIEPPPIEYQSLTVEQILNRFQSELETDTVAFLHEAQRIANYDATLRDTQHALSELTNQVSRLMLHQNEVDTQLRGIGSYQNELSTTLDQLERNVDELFAAQSNITIEDADVEREKSYQRALEVDDKLTQMTGKLEAVVNDLNSAQERALNSGREGTNDEVGKIIGIFNAHHETLAVLDNKARAVEADMATLSQVLARTIEHTGIEYNHKKPSRKDEALSALRWDIWKWIEEAKKGDCDPNCGDLPSYEQSPAAPSEDPSHAPTASREESSTGPSVSSSGEPSLSRSVPPSEQPSENPSEAPVTTQPTTLYPSTVQATTPQSTLSSSPTQTIEQPRFPEYPEPPNASSAYFNYNLTQGSRFGPSAWKRVSVPADNYWGEFLSLDNQCGNEFGQSPIDLCTAPSRYCQEFHEFRSRPGDFGIEGRSMQKQILANKLVSHLDCACASFFCTDMHNRKHEKRVLVERRTGDEPDPPHVDFAGVGARELDLLNIDISFPSEHTVCGKRFAGEMRYYFYHPMKLVFVAIAFLLETSDEAPANGHMQLLIDEFRYLHERHDKLCQWSATERKGSTNVTADEAAEPVRRLRKNAWNPFHPDIQKTVHFWGYTGSLTEPPCSGWSVLWRIMDVPVVLSKEQIGQMRTVLFTNRDPKTCLFTSVHSSDAVARPIQRPIRYYKCRRQDYVR